MEIFELSLDEKPIRLLATTRDGAIRELVLSLAKSGRVPELLVESTIRILVDREQLGSTAIGKGIAVPHARTPYQPDIAMCSGISKTGIDWSAADGQPVRVVLLMLSGNKHCGEHIEVLSHISRIVRDDAFVKRVLAENGL